MSNIVKSIEQWFEQKFKGTEAQTIGANVAAFVKTDVGRLAVDSVEYVAATLPSADAVAKRNAAVAKLKTDAKTAGKDLEALGASTLNWCIETALQAVQAKGIV